MAKETVRFVGGSLDGETREVEPGQNEYTTWQTRGDRALPGEPEGEKDWVCIWQREKSKPVDGELPVFNFVECRFQVRPKKT